MSSEIFRLHAFDTFLKHMAVLPRRPLINCSSLYYDHSYAADSENEKYGSATNSLVMKTKFSGEY